METNEVFLLIMTTVEENNDFHIDFEQRNRKVEFFENGQMD